MSEENRIRNLMILDYSQLIMYASSLEELNDINHKEIERLNKIIKHVEDICESSIVSVNQILQDEKETIILNGRCINRNEYQIVRLKAYRTKSKEILERIKELKGSESNE